MRSGLYLTLNDGTPPRRRLASEGEKTQRLAMAVVIGAADVPTTREALISAELLCCVNRFWPLSRLVSISDLIP